jgi:hypothetical protein
MKNLELEDLLPEALLNRCTFHQDLCGIPYPEVLQAIDIASAQKIAILGVELFRVDETTLHFLTGSGYEIAYTGEWDRFVRENNTAARAFITNNVPGERHVYILTSVSRKQYVDIIAG